MLRYLFFIGLLAGSAFPLVVFSQADTTAVKDPVAKARLISYLTKEYGQHKLLPAGYELQVLLALSHFQELKYVKIKYIVKATYTPLSTKPDFWSMFKRKSRRSYMITLSNKTIDTLKRLLYENLDFEEQVGIMGHELSHVVDFRSKSLLRSLRTAIGLLFPRFVDKMEYHTDMICIQHGLGKQLEAYSMHVRNVMHVHDWRGVDYVDKTDNKYERYMNPDTIERYMKSFSK